MKMQASAGLDRWGSVGGSGGPKHPGPIAALIWPSAVSQSECWVVPDERAQHLDHREWKERVGMRKARPSDTPQSVRVRSLQAASWNKCV